MSRKKKAAKQSSTTRPASQPHYDIDFIRSACRGRCVDILSRLGGISPDLLDGNHHACPKCGGTDRFRLIDEEAGAIFCNQCASSGIGDVFASLEWITGRKFADVLKLVADHLGIEPSSVPASHKLNGHHPAESADPAENLTFQPWDESTELLAQLWCLTKPPITLPAIRAVGGQLARYRDQYTVLALPIYGESLDKAKPVGWCLYNITGGQLPKWAKRKPDGTQPAPEWVKVKLTFGSQPGIIVDLARLAAAEEVWKVEGPSDLLAFLSLPELPPGVSGVTNANGSKENPPPWVLSLFTGKRARTLHDADKPGQEGATGWTDPRSHRHHIGWAPAIASKAAECRNVQLPYPLADDHGKDLRDYLNEIIATQATVGPLVPLLSPYAHLTKLADASPLTLPPTEAPKPLEAPDNYHRLARVNLERYGRNTPNGTLRYWRNEWYKYDGTCYRKIDTDELKAKVGQAVREEFERINAEEIAAFDGDGEPPNVRNVGHALISNVLFATAQLCILSGTVEFNTWIDGPLRDSSHRFVALQNGILDIDALLAGEPVHLHPHSPYWFSVTCLPFEFNDTADCPTFQSFLQRNLEADEQRISLLMEWAGYCLLPNTDYQKFMFFEGEGANGKSVFLAAIEAMIGENNCSHVSLEAFSKDFVLTQTLGKLINIASECSEMDSVAEGMLKAVASGDRMTFNRKGIPPIEATPTARLMLSANVRPRFADKSSGLWRRMILMPWRVVIPESQRTIGMDKVAWWEASGELAGIFNWAIAGLDQLNSNRRFTRSDVCEAALADYRSEINPAKVFLVEHYVPNSISSVATKDIYDHYKEWSLEHGYRPMSERTFGKEVFRQFTEVSRERAGGRDNRHYVYRGIIVGNRDDQQEAKQESKDQNGVSCVPSVSYQSQEIGHAVSDLF